MYRETLIILKLVQSNLRNKISNLLTVVEVIYCQIRQDLSLSHLFLNSLGHTL